MKIVLDTTVLVRAHNRSGALARRVLHEICQRNHTLVLSNEIINETARVLRYPYFQDLYALSEAEIFEYSQFLQSISDIVLLDPGYNAAVLRDPTDAHILQTAEQSEADILCTFDSDFFDAAVISYCTTRGIQVCTERSLLTRLSD